MLFFLLMFNNNNKNRYNTQQSLGCWIFVFLLQNHLLLMICFHTIT